MIVGLVPEANDIGEPLYLLLPLRIGTSVCAVPKKPTRRQPNGRLAPIPPFSHECAETAEPPDRIVPRPARRRSGGPCFEDPQAQDCVSTHQR